MRLEKEARKGITDRARGYDPDGRYFKRVAKSWSAILDKKVTPAQVCLMMAALKIIRLANYPEHHDSLADLIGYAMCLEREVAKYGHRTTKQKG